MSLNMVWKYGWNAQNWIISVANERYKNGISDYVIIFLINLSNLPRHRLQKGKNHRFWHSIAGNHKYHNLWNLCLAMPLKRIISTLTNNLIIHKWIYNLYKFIHEYSDRNIRGKYTLIAYFTTNWDLWWFSATESQNGNFCSFGASVKEC